METLVLKNLNDDVLSTLRQLASLNRLTIEEQAELLLSQVSRQEVRRNRVEILQSIAAMTPKGVKQTDSVELLREDRDR